MRLLSMTSGKYLSRLAYPVATILSYFFSILPSFVASFIWSCTAVFGGEFALLVRYSIVLSRVIGIGRNVYFGTNVVLKNISCASFGKNVSIHDFCYIDAQGGLSIGDDVSIAHSCSIITLNHTWANPSTAIKYNPVSPGKVIIANDVWIGCGVRIMSGVKIGSRSVVAAGAVVIADVPSGVLVAGVPAKIIKKIY